MTPPAAAQPAPVITPLTAEGPLIGAILARLAALNSADPQLAALLAQYQTATGKAFGT